MSFYFIYNERAWELEGEREREGENEKEFTEQIPAL